MTSSDQSMYDLLYASRPDRVLWGDQPGRLIPRIRDFVQGGYVLDAGCGDGKNALYMERKGYIVRGFDRSLHALSGLRNRFSLAEKECCGTYDLADVRELDFLGPATYDIVVSYGLFHCLSPNDRIDVHRNLQRKLKVGGVLVFSSLTDDIPLPSFHGTPGMALPDRREIDALLKGFTIHVDFDGTIAESHLPVVGKHEHSARWAICRREP